MEKRRYNELSAGEAARDSSPALHFTARLDEKRGLYRFVCETQPLMTLTSHGLPKRCPLCGQDYPTGSEKPSMKGEAKC